MQKDLEGEDLALVRGLLHRERVACAVLVGQAHTEGRSDVEATFRARMERCRQLEATLETPEGPHLLLFRNPTAPDEAVRA